MTIDALVTFAVSQPLSPEVFDQVCAQTKLSLPEVYEAFARAIVEGYSKKKLSWSDCDVAMTALFGYVYAVPGGGDLPDYAFRAYIAFDEGEYRPGGEAVTQKLLAELK